MKNAMKFREKLHRHQMCLGVAINFYDPTVTDSLCSLVDFVWIDMEHNALSLEAVQAHIMATEAHETTALVRVRSHDPAVIKTVLDLGADGIIVPNVRTPDEARRAVAACRYPPEGIRGYGPRRPSLYGRIEGAAFCKAANRTIIAVTQIEHIDAVRDIDKILAVPGLDSIVLGPNDLSGSIGHICEPKHPEVVSAMETVISSARRSNVAVGVGGGEPGEIRYWIERGVHWAVAGGDNTLMLKAAHETLEELRRHGGR